MNKLGEINMLSTVPKDSDDSEIISTLVEDTYVDFICFSCGKTLDPVSIKNYELVMLPTEPFPVFCRDCLYRHKKIFNTNG
jgi:hypothetical protein